MAHHPFKSTQHNKAVLNKYLHVCHVIAVQVKKAAWSTMTACFKLQGNRDIEPCVPSMLSCIARPAEVPDAITKLSGTTFVQVTAVHV